MFTNLNLRLNPCFNGRWTTTFYENRTSIHFSVSILVLMDNGLRLSSKEAEAIVYKCLNPCFIGQWATTVWLRLHKELLKKSLNPCFNGQWATTKSKNGYKQLRGESQSLF